MIYPPSPPLPSCEIKSEHYCPRNLPKAYCSRKWKKRTPGPKKTGFCFLFGPEFNHVQELYFSLYLPPIEFFFRLKFFLTQKPPKDIRVLFCKILLLLYGLKASFQPNNVMFQNVSLSSLQQQTDKA